jgi:hypothetical protein
MTSIDFSTNGAATTQLGNVNFINFKGFFWLLQKLAGTGPDDTFLTPFPYWDLHGTVVHFGWKIEKLNTNQILANKQVISIFELGTF